ncbi:MAG: hypothetical protein H0T79_20460 [Deltaproteobacteria bacterium]|nr:hypothetical protein [Deltaproteobacteria bacterium]
MLIVIHSGQTGVERGAHRAAVAAGIQLAGFSPLDGRDELGPLPEAVSQYLTPCFERGSRPPVRANVALASGLLVVVPDARIADKFTGIGVTLKIARELAVPYRIADPSTNSDELVAWARSLPETSGSVRLMVTGPRETRWADGEKVAWQIVAAIGLT